MLEQAVSRGISRITKKNSQLRNLLGWKQNASKCLSTKKQIERVSTHPVKLYNESNLDDAQQKDRGTISRRITKCVTIIMCIESVSNQCYLAWKSSTEQLPCWDYKQ